MKKNGKKSFLPAQSKAKGKELQVSGSFEFIQALLPDTSVSIQEHVYVLISRVSAVRKSAKRQLPLLAIDEASVRKRCVNCTKNKEENRTNDSCADL